MYRWGLIRFWRRRAEDSGHAGLIEQREEDGDALDDRGAELGIERHPVVQVPPLDRLDLLLGLAACAALAFLGLERDPELGEPIPEDRVEPARHRVLTGGIYPDPVIQRFRMADHVVVGDDDARRARLSHQVLGLADSLGEQLRVDRAAVDILQRDPAPRQEPVQFDDPAHEVRIGLLPERLAALAEELVDQG